MINKRKKYATTLALFQMALAVNSSAMLPTTTTKRNVIKNNEATVPNGCHWYHFDYKGNIIGIYNRNTGAGYFACIALNEKSARKKFLNRSATA